MTTRFPSRSVQPGQATVLDAANLYLDEIYLRAKANQVSWPYYTNSHSRLKRALEALGPTLPLHSIGKTELSAAVLKLAARPPCRPQPYQKRPVGQPVARVTAKQYIMQLKTLFAWVAEHDDLNWERPKGFARLFRIKDRRLMTAEEQEREARVVISGEVETFTVDELTSLFRAGRSLVRLYILLGLNCGFTSGEISALRTFEVYLDEEQPFIHRRRAKTGIEAKWLLWPETAKLLRRHMAPANVDRRWLLTEAGNPLVYIDERHRRDSIGVAWKALVPRTRMQRWLGFRFLRKTGANAIKRLGGIEESEMYLAHQELGLNKHYANRNWDKMWRCLEKYREQLPFLGKAWDIDPDECLFTQDSNPDWADVNPPWVQRVNKRSETGLLNVSLHKGKGKYYARVYCKGRTHFAGYFDKPEQAAKAARKIRAALDGAVVRLGNRAHGPGVQLQQGSAT